MGPRATESFGEFLAVDSLPVHQFFDEFRSLENEALLLESLFVRNSCASKEGHDGDLLARYKSRMR
jgi:hypothetical protein